MEKIKLSRPVLCEGKYDKIKLSAVIDGQILTTDGFSVFHNRDKQALLRRLCETRGLIIITDSDRAGFFIRQKLRGMLPDRGNITQLYIPQIKGREKRKTEASKDGLLGVEGMKPELLRELLLRAGLENEDSLPPPPVSKAVLYEMGLSGGQDSTEKRKKVCRALELPENLASNAKALAEACSLLRIDEEALRRAAADDTEPTKTKE